MIKKMAFKWASVLKKSNPRETASVAVMQFALEIVINFISIIILSLFLASFFGTVSGTLIAMTAFAVLRAVSGGVHLPASGLCIAVSTTLFVTIPHIPLSWSTSMILTSVSLVLAAVFAPSRIERQSRIPRNYYPLLKIVSILLISVNYWIASDVLALTFFIQGMLLIRLPTKRQSSTPSA